MGYTHYFEFRENIDAFHENVLKKVRKITDKYKDILQFEYDEERPAIVKPTLIRFNGIDEDGHETFYLEPSTGFNFCKTARKPYDLPICEVLLVLKDYYGTRFELSSDGFYINDDEEIDGMWEPALENVKDMFGITFNKDRLLAGY